MKRNRNRIFWVLMAFVLMIGLFSASALAVDSVDPSDTLDVYLKTSAGTTFLHTYDLSEMEDLAKGEDIEYSSIDSMPATVYTIATGVYVEDLLDDVQEYTEMDVWDFSRLRFKATDGATGNFTYDDLFEDRYYYPGLHEDGHGLNEDQEIDYEVGEGIPVDPMLAIEAWQTRKPMPGEYRDPYEPECYTILFGMSEEELEKVKKRTSDYKRGICELTIDMGNVSPPTTEEVAVTGIDLDKPAAEITVGNKLQLNATIEPNNATNKGVKWETSDDSVAAVSSEGLVTGVAAGTATITATADGDDTVSKTCTITVSPQDNSENNSGNDSGNDSESISVSKVVLSKSELTIAVGKEKTLTATVSPANASDRDVTWKSSDTGIAKVDQDGTVKGIKEGGVTITATADGRFDTCRVTVIEADVPVEGIKLNHSSLTLAKENSFQLMADVSPAAATNSTVLWSSDAPGIVSVDTEGLITAKNTGSAVITAATEDGSFIARCTITVSGSTSVFSDIEDNWAKKEIESMVGLGFITGYDDGTFRPGSTVTRAEFLSILVRIMEKTQNIQLQGDNAFQDTAGHWAKDYISTAVKLGVTTGYEGNKFAPNDKITREQIAVMLAAAAGYDQNQPDVSFSDSPLISAWAVSAVSYTINEGLFTGYEDGSFGPKKNATRAEVSALLMRFYEKITEIND
ncbi:MAG: Ig-like domain-containing protein [Dehalobacterium sp.]